jgi:hypothetical protein
MTRHEDAWNTPEILTSDLPIFYALFLSIVRFATEKYGGTMATDLVTGSTRIHVPHWTAYAYMEEIRELMGPGKALNDLFCLLDDWKTFPTITVI